MFVHACVVHVSVHMCSVIGGKSQLCVVVIVLIDEVGVLLVWIAFVYVCPLTHCRLVSSVIVQKRKKNSECFDHLLFVS